jgi:hypothetical protein
MLKAGIQRGYQFDSKMLCFFYFYITVVACFLALLVMIPAYSLLPVLLFVVPACSMSHVLSLPLVACRMCYLLFAVGD